MFLKGRENVSVKIKLNRCARIHNSPWNFDSEESFGIVAFLEKHSIKTVDKGIVFRYYL